MKVGRPNQLPQECPWSTSAHHWLIGSLRQSVTAANLTVIQPTRAASNSRLSPLFGSPPKNVNVRPTAAVKGVRHYSSSNLPSHKRVALPALSPTMEMGTVVVVSWQKATMGFETPEDGYLARILIQEETKDVPIGELLCIIVENESEVAAFKDFQDDGAAAAPSSAPEPGKAEKPAPAAASPPIGGSDQLGHLDFGSHFLKRTLGCDFAAGVSLPLVTDSAGNKLGKSVGEGVWLRAKRTSPFNFYQFFRQLHDTEAEQMLISFSLRPLEEVYALIKDHKSNLGKWIAQEALAAELTTVVHGGKGLNTALQCSRALFHGSIEDVKSLDSETLLSLFGTVTEVSLACVSTVGDLADLTRSDRQKGSVLMTKGALKLNGEKVTTPDQPLDFSAIILPQTDNLSLVCWGKRKFQLVRLV